MRIARFDRIDKNKNKTASEVKEINKKNNNMKTKELYLNAGNLDSNKTSRLRNTTNLIKFSRDCNDDR